MPYTSDMPTSSTRSEKQRRRLPARKTQRLEARVSLEQKQLLERAAEIRGMSLTEFVLASCQAAAAHTIREDQVIELGMRDREVFVSALLNPPAPNSRLLEAARRYREKLSS